MKLITIEEHYTSNRVSQKIQDILAGKAGGSAAAGNAAPDGPGPAASRLSHMDAHGIDTQIISIADALPAAMEPQYAVPLCRELNDELAELVKRYPGRLYAFAHLPLSSPPEAAAELERCVKELGAVGAMLSGHVQELPYDDAHYFPVFEKAQELDVPVYLHPGAVPQAVVNAYYKGAWDARTTAQLAGFGMGWHYDVGLQAVRMMAAGVFDKLPRLKIILGHWGELVSFYMDRLDEMLDAGGAPGKKYSGYFKENIYVNPSGMLYSGQFRYCMETFGAEHILWGEDYPYRQKDDIRTFLEGFDLAQEDREKIAHGNAEQLLRLDR